MKRYLALFLASALFGALMAWQLDLKAQEAEAPAAAEESDANAEAESAPAETPAAKPAAANAPAKQEGENQALPNKDVASLDDLEEDVDEFLEDESVKVIYKTPDSCKEFTMYLDSKALKLEKMDRELKKKERLLNQMQADFEAITTKFAETEKRIKEMIQHDPSNLKDNPELAKMIKLYETFSAEEAAARLQNLDLDLTLAILRGMKPKTLSKIMTAMDPKLSAALSSQLIRGF
ncbi:MAG: hypothetical protein H7A33_07090 [Deltaproteobacteria bacterium]|nr:hypothetical protein [Deltaproteobacteria bacterium]